MEIIKCEEQKEKRFKKNEQNLRDLSDTNRPTNTQSGRYREKRQRKGRENICKNNGWKFLRSAESCEYEQEAQCSPSETDSKRPTTRAQEHWTQKTGGWYIHKGKTVNYISDSLQNCPSTVREKLRHSQINKSWGSLWPLDLLYKKRSWESGKGKWRGTRQ